MILITILLVRRIKGVIWLNYSCAELLYVFSSF